MKFSAGVKPSSKVVYPDQAQKGGTTNIVVDQSGTSNQWVLLGVFDFEERSKYSIRVRNAASSGNAIIERFRFGMGSLSGYKYNNIASGVPSGKKGQNPTLEILEHQLVYTPFVRARHEGATQTLLQ